MSENIDFYFMRLHIFNPSHDLAMAANTPNFTAPHAARQLAHDLGFMPALWCDDGDVVLVGNVEAAELAASRILINVRRVGLDIRKKVTFVDWDYLQFIENTDSIEPWGWDVALKHRLQRAGMPDSLLPSDARIEELRQLSHRRTSAKVLGEFEGFRVRECHGMDELHATVADFGTAVIKMPWSSSGRGLRYLESHNLNPHQEGWARNVIAKQGSVMVEPWYDKIMDFAMEFSITADGNVTYLGLSLFYTENGQYRGNMLATESTKEELLTRYVPVEYLKEIKLKLMAVLPHHLINYNGVFGVDMMLIRQASGTIAIHPCVEINLRRTIGHAALAVSPTDCRYEKALRIEFDGEKYRLRITGLK